MLVLVVAYLFTNLILFRKESAHPLVRAIWLPFSDRSVLLLATSMPFAADGTKQTLTGEHADLKARIYGWTSLSKLSRANDLSHIFEARKLFILWFIHLTRLYNLLVYKVLYFFMVGLFKSPSSSLKYFRAAAATWLAAQFPNFTRVSGE